MCGGRQASISSNEKKKKFSTLREFNELSGELSLEVFPDAWSSVLTGRSQPTDSSYHKVTLGRNEVRMQTVKLSQ